jgi:hypothetical protein
VYRTIKGLCLYDEGRKDGLGASLEERGGRRYACRVPEAGCTQSCGRKEAEKGPTPAGGRPAPPRCDGDALDTFSASSGRRRLDLVQPSPSVAVAMEDAEGGGVEEEICSTAGPARAGFKSRTRRRTSTCCILPLADSLGPSTGS